MKITDLVELDASAPAPSTITQPTAQQINDPKIQTQMLAAQQKEKVAQRKQLQDQITALTKQLADLRQQLAKIQ